MQCSLKFGHGKQENRIKELNAELKKFKEKQFTLEAKIKLLDQELKECKEKITGTEDYFHMSTLRVELKSLRKAKKLLNNDTKKAKTKSKTKKKAKNIKEKELHQQIKDLEHQLKAFNERDEILALNETKKSIQNKINKLRKKIVENKNKLDPNKEEEINARELNELVKSTNMHHHTKSCLKYGNDCR